MSSKPEPDKQLAKLEAQPLATTDVQPLVPYTATEALIHFAIANKQDATKLHDILREERAHQAEVAFIAALVKFQSECP